MNDFLGVNQFEEKIKDHFLCVNRILGMYTTIENLKKLNKEATLPNVCFVELVNLRSVINTDALTYEKLHPTYYQKEGFIPSQDANGKQI